MWPVIEVVTGGNTFAQAPIYATWDSMPRWRSAACGRAAGYVQRRDGRRGSACFWFWEEGFRRGLLLSASEDRV
jgi:hypothetical protein